MSKFKMVKVEYEGDDGIRQAYINPKEVVDMHKAWRYVSPGGSVFGDPKGARTRISLRNGNDAYSGKELAEMVAEIEAAANG